MYAEEYGADAETRTQLWSLTPGSYDALSAVLGALGLAGGPRPLHAAPARRGVPLPAARRPAR